MTLWRTVGARAGPLKVVVRGAQLEAYDLAADPLEAAPFRTSLPPAPGPRPQTKEEGDCIVVK